MTITPGGDDDSGDTTITLPKIYIEETEEGYTFTYRDLDSEEADPITIPKAGGVKFDDVTLTTNETGEAHIVGYSDDLGAGMYLGTDVNGSWGVHQMPTNTVGVEDITTGWAPDDGSGIRKVNLKNWDYSYNGTDPLFLVNDGGALAYVPLLGSNTVVKLDNVSIWSNEVGEVEIKDFSGGGRGGCSESTADILVADADETGLTHEFLARATSSGGDATLHYVSVGRLPHPDDDYFTTDNDTKRFRLTTTEGKFLVGAADNGFTWVDAPGSPVDGVSIVTNAQGHAGQAAIAGFWDASEEGDVLTRTSEGVAWRPAAGSVDDLSIVTNRYGKLGLKGYEDVSEGQFPVVSSGGSLEWVSTNVLATSKFTGSFSYFDGHIHDGCVMVGRTPILVTGMDASSGDYRVRVTLGTSPTAVLEQGNGFTAPSGTTSYIPVYSLSNGEIVGDYRGSFVVPSYE